MGGLNTKNKNIEGGESPEGLMIGSDVTNYIAFFPQLKLKKKILFGALLLHIRLQKQVVNFLEPDSGNFEALESFCRYKIWTLLYK